MSHTVTKLPEHTRLLPITHTHAHTLSQSQSKFAAAYAAGVNKAKYWETIYEDSMDLIAKLPELAALVYRRSYYNRSAVQQPEVTACKHRHAQHGTRTNPHGSLPCCTGRKLASPLRTDTHKQPRF